MSNTNSGSGKSLYSPNASSNDRGGNTGQGYTVKNSGTNSEGNHYCSRDYSTSSYEPANSNSYHYSNTNGSYYYSNPNGSTYYNSGDGHSKYTPSGAKK